MSLAPNTENYMLGRGRIYFNKFDANGNPTGWLDLGNAPAFAVGLTTDKLEHYSSRSGLRVKDKTVIMGIDVALKFTLDEFSVENLNLAFLGNIEDFLQTAGSATDESVTAISDRYVDLVYRKLTSGTVVVTDSSSATTYVEGTDYLVDYDAGMIIAKGSGSIADGDTILVSYDYGAITSQAIKAVTNPEIRGQLKFVGDPAAGTAYEGLFWDVALSATGDIGFITESDWGQMEFEGEITKDDQNHPDSPYYNIYAISS
jgi:hypothetical protein